MNRPIAFDATPTVGYAESTFVNRSFALWAFIIALVAVTCTVLVLDASITPEQRIAVFQQSGVFP